MHTHITKISDITAPTLCFCISQKKDIISMDFLHISPQIRNNILTGIREKKSCIQEYFLGGKKYVHLVVFICHEKEKKQQELFFGKHFPKYTDNLCLFAAKQDILLSFYEVCVLSRYTFRMYTDNTKHPKTQVYIQKSDMHVFQESKRQLDIIFQVRDLGNMPPCDLTPEIFTKHISKTKYKNFSVRILDHKDIKKQKLGLIDAVGSGSINAPRFVILERIVDKKLPTIALIGKGVTFDTGGTQIKSGNLMYSMKGDMGGAAVVYGISQVLDSCDVHNNYVIAIPLVENSVSGSAYRPSDIIRAYNGKTVEIIHTDAEGRLILADAISYVEKKYAPQKTLTVATLTGACVMALGYRYAGVMGNDPVLIKKFTDYGKKSLEAYFELPFDDLFQEDTRSEIADYKNLSQQTFAGASMGAAFLSQFIENNHTYVHIDIAGTYMNEYIPYGRCPKTMTGFGVESISHILRSL